VTSTRLLARNTALNLFGQMAPLVVAVVAVPPLIRHLGSDRFGVLTLAWALIGYFGLFDFGLGRALTQAASEALAREDHAGLRDLSLTSIVAMFGLGVVGAIVSALATHWLVYDMLNMSAELRSEAAPAFYLLAVSLPFVVATIGLRGLLEAHQHFGLATALRVPYALFNFLGPLAVVPFSRSLVPIVGALVVGRIVLFAAHVYVCFREYPWLRQGRLMTRQEMAPLFRLGGWMTVSNIVSPLMVNLDRFVVGALISVTAVAFYVTPYEVVTKLLFIPSAVLGVFFPAFAASFVQDPERTSVMFDRAVRLMMLVMFPLCLVAVAIGHEGLLVWVGPEYARQSTRVLQILAIGVLINSVAQVAFALLQATKRADITAKLHLVELPVYVALIAILGRKYALPGVALAWTLRMTIDTGALFWFTKRRLSSAAALGQSMLWLTGMVAGLVAVSLADSLMVRVALAGTWAALFVAAGWRTLIREPERQLILRFISLRRQAVDPA
jgi:O-antigen/teichoic acid export membrane protein